MGLFTQKPQEPSAWAALPGEPLEDDNPSERLDEAPAVDLFSVGGTVSTSVVIPVAPTPPGPAEKAIPEGE